MTTAPAPSAAVDKRGTQSPWRMYYRRNGRALNAFLTARTPAEAALAQGSWMTAAMGRAVSDGWAFGASMLKLQAETLAPIHAAAVANAKRLKK